MGTATAERAADSARAKDEFFAAGMYMFHITGFPQQPGVLPGEADAPAGLHQVIIHATITDATPQTITGLLTDPRTDQAPPAHTPASTTQDHSSHLAADTG